MCLDDGTYHAVDSSEMAFRIAARDAFVEAFNLIADGGWIAFNIKEDFLNGKDTSGFSRLIQNMTDRDNLSIRSRKRYPHRLATDHQPLHYVAIVGRKLHDIS